MTDNALKIAIAKALGWTAHRNPEKTKCGADIPSCEALIWEHDFVPPQFKGDRAYHRKLPEWPTDLNACHDMEAALGTSDMVAYWHHLLDGNRLYQGSITAPSVIYMVRATARQRCEAFLRTKGTFSA